MPATILAYATPTPLALTLPPDQNVFTSSPSSSSQSSITPTLLGGRNRSGRSSVAFAAHPPRVHPYDPETRISTNLVNRNNRVASLSGSPRMPLKTLSQCSSSPTVSPHMEKLLAPTPRPKSILKDVDTPIRVAISVDEGTRSNTEEQRPPRPPFLARDSFGPVKPGGEPSSDSSDGSSEYAEGSGAKELLEAIIDDQSDYYAVEDAYHQLQARLRARLQLDREEMSVEEMAAADELVAPFKDRSVALLFALKRHVAGVMAPAPTSILDSSSPIQPLAPTLSSTPSPSPTRASNATRKGFSEAEVQARRAASLAGQQALRFIAFLLHRPELFCLYSDADLTSLLQSVLVIPFSPRLNTPNPKKTYPLSIYPLSHVRIPSAAIQPLLDRILNAVLNKAIDQSSCAWGGQPSPKQGEGGNVNARREGFLALANLVRQYPQLFLPRHAEIIPVVIRALSNSSPVVRVKATLAAGAIVKAKMWARRNGMRDVATAVESTTAGYFLKPTLGRAWLEFQESLSKAFGTHYGWASTAWALVVSMLGDQFVSKPILSKPLNKMLLTPLCSASSQENSPGRAAISRFAWDHLLHAVVTYNQHPDGTFDLEHSFGKARQLAFTLAIGTAHHEAQSQAASIVDGRWHRSDSLSKQKWVVYCTASATSAVFAWSAIAQTDDRRNELFDEVLSATLRHMMSVKALDEVKTKAWQLLEAVVGNPHQVSDLDRLLHEDVVSGKILGGESPASKDDVVERDALAMQDDITPSDICGWGETWIVGKFAQGLGALTKVALDSVHGLQNVNAVEWVEVEGRKVVPAILLGLWRHMLKAMSDGLRGNLMEVVRIILGVYTSDEPLLPPAIACNADLARVDLVRLLLDTAIEALPSLVNVRLPLSGPDSVRNASAPPSLMGADNNGNPTSIGAMLDKISRTPPRDEAVRSTYVDLFRKLLFAGIGAKLLGDVTNALPGLGGDDATRQMMWRHIANAWSTHLACQVALPRTPTNHTGVMLVELLSWPFRESATVASWHSGATDDEMSAWKSLLGCAVTRSFQKHIGPNLAVLDPIAAHFEDFNGDDDRQLSTTTLSCLTALVQAMAFDANVYESSSFHDGVNHIPEDFLHLVNETLSLAVLQRRMEAVSLVNATARAIIDLRGAPATRALDIVDFSCWLDLELDVPSLDLILGVLLHTQASEAMVSRAVFCSKLDEDDVLLAFAARWNVRPLGDIPDAWRIRLESLQQRCSTSLQMSTPPLQLQAPTLPQVGSNSNDADLSPEEAPAASDTFAAPEIKSSPPESRKRTSTSLTPSDDSGRNNSQRRKANRAAKRRRLSATPPAVDEPEEECIVVSSPQLGSQPRLDRTASGGIGSTLGNFLTRIPSFFSPSKRAHTLPPDVTPTALLAGERNAWHGPDITEGALEPTQTATSGSDPAALPLDLVTRALEHKADFEQMDTEDILKLVDRADELKRKAMATLAKRMKALEGKK